MKKNIVGNFLLVILIFFSGTFYYYSLSVSESHIFHASLMTFVMIFFYFYGKGIFFNNVNPEKVSLTYKILSRSVIAIIAILLPLIINHENFGVENWFIFSFLLSICLIIGFDFKSYIDSALEIQVYGEIPKGGDYLAINLTIFILLAILLVIFFPKFI